MGGRRATLDREGTEVGLPPHCQAPLHPCHLDSASGGVFHALLSPPRCLTLPRWPPSHAPSPPSVLARRVASVLAHPGKLPPVFRVRQVSPGHGTRPGRHSLCPLGPLGASRTWDERPLCSVRDCLRPFSLLPHVGLCSIPAPASAPLPPSPGNVTRGPHTVLGAIPIADRPSPPGTCLRGCRLALSGTAP